MPHDAHNGPIVVGSRVRFRGRTGTVTQIHEAPAMVTTMNTDAGEKVVEVPSQTVLCIRPDDPDEFEFPDRVEVI